MIVTYQRVFVIFGATLQWAAVSKVLKREGVSKESFEVIQGDREHGPAVRK
jgi:hypothetical protein